MKTMNENLRNIGDVLCERGFTFYAGNEDNFGAWIAKTSDRKYVVVDSDYGCTVWDVLSGLRDSITDDEFAHAVVGSTHEYEDLRAICNITEVGIIYALGVNEYF